MKLKTGKKRSKPRVDFGPAIAHMKQQERLKDWARREDELNREAEKAILRAAGHVPPICDWERTITISRSDIINDDLGAFAKVPEFSQFVSENIEKVAQNLGLPADLVIGHSHGAGEAEAILRQAVEKAHEENRRREEAERAILRAAGYSDFEIQVQDAIAAFERFTGK